MHEVQIVTRCFFSWFPKDHVERSTKNKEHVETVTAKTLIDHACRQRAKWAMDYLGLHLLYEDYCHNHIAVVIREHWPAVDCFW